MIRLLQLLIFGHVHKWKIIKEGPFTLYGEDEAEMVQRGTQYNVQCEHCGAVKRYRA